MWIAVAAVSCRQPPRPTATTPEQIRPTYNGSGALTKLEADSDHDGLIDMWAYMDGARVVRVEVDENGDGTVDRWEYHAVPPDGQAEQAAATTTPRMPRPLRLLRGGLESPDKTIERIERSTHKDGIVSRWEYFENGFLVRIEEDRNGDGRLDKWETYSDGSLSMMAIDTTHRGTADRRLVYRPDGTLDRIEVDPTGTGIFRPLSPAAK